MSLREMLEQEVEMYEHLGLPREQNLTAAVLQHGQAYELDREASAQQEKGKLKNCFGNAATLALFDDELTYVEGFAYHGLMPMHHAWVINREGKALEVTWRDGGDECGHCVEGERELDEDEQGYDEDDESTWTEECRFCGGTGKSKYGHQTLEGVEYYGIAIDNEALREALVRTGTWGVFDTLQDLERVLDARR